MLFTKMLKGSFIATTLLSVTAYAAIRGEIVRPTIPIRSVPAPSRTVQKLVIELSDAHYQGQNTLKLKNLANSAHSGIELENYDLESVRLVAKSRGGNGKATLVVGQQDSFTYDIDGTAADFFNQAAYTFDRLDIVNPKNNSNGVWQIGLKGNIIVRKVVLLLEEKVTTLVSASCKVSLLEGRGAIKEFDVMAQAQSYAQAQAKACKQAFNKCEKAAERLGIAQRRGFGCYQVQGL